MRVVYFGTTEFAATVLRRVCAGTHHVALVVAPPDRPRGRGRRLASPAVAQAAGELGLEVLQTESTAEERSLAAIRAARPEIGLVCAFGQIIREPLLGELELLNVHPSLLPRWRGAAPIERAIMAGDEETGVSVIRLTAELDAGPIALAERVPVEGRDYGALSAALARLGGELAVRALDLAAAGELHFREQPEEGLTYAEKIDPAERRLDPGRPAEELARVVRALTPHIGAHLELAGGGRLGVRAAEAEDGALGEGETAADGELLVGCAQGVLRIRTLQPPGRKPMPAADYLRGHELPRLAPSG